MIGETGGMKIFRIASTLFGSALFLVACGDDKMDTEATQTDPTNATPATPGTTTMTDPSGTTVDPTNEPTTAGPGSNPTSETDPTANTDPTNSTDPTGDPSGMFCAEHCAADGDCTLMGMDLGYTCKEGVCAGGCTDDASCVVQFSGWITDCAAQAECPGQVCIDIGGGVGKCATPPSDFVMCEAFMQVEVMFPAIEGGMDLTVCANTSYTCNADSGQCENPCNDNTECMLNVAHPSCNTDTGICECTADSDCMGAMLPGYVKCNAGVCGCGADADCAGVASGTKCTAQGFCGCASDAECTAANGDTCYDGLCGCSSDATCTAKVFDGTSQMCESF
jgi:hypothetical protein